MDLGKMYFRKTRKTLIIGGKDVAFADYKIGTKVRRYEDMLYYFCYLSCAWVLHLWFEPKTVPHIFIDW
jgi:hypothetical protein